MLTHRHVMRIKNATLHKILVVITLFPALTFLTSGINRRINKTGRSHNKTNSGTGKFPEKLRMLINSMLIKGSKIIKLITAGVMMVVEIFLIIMFVYYRAKC